MGKGVQAKWKLLLKMRATCKGGQNVHEIFSFLVGADAMVEGKLSFVVLLFRRCLHPATVPQPAKKDVVQQGRAGLRAATSAVA